MVTPTITSKTSITTIIKAVEEELSKEIVAGIHVEASLEQSVYAFTAGEVTL